jgi:hypothetical protein
LIFGSLSNDIFKIQ